jgi:HK97 family phage major capsid protein
MKLSKVTAAYYATDEVLADAPFMASKVNELVSKELAFKVDDSLINGLGAGQPLGFLNAPALISVTKETGQSAKTISFENVIKMFARHWSGSSATTTRWVVNREAFPQLMTKGIKVGTAGFPVFLPGNSAIGGPAFTLLGIPVIFAEQALALGTKGDIYLADFNQYRMIAKGGIQAASSMHVQFLYDEMVYRFILRTNGQPLWKTALTPYKGTSSTLSPFVALADRA